LKGTDVFLGFTGPGGIKLNQMILAGVVVTAIMFAPTIAVSDETPATLSSSDSSSVAGVTPKVVVQKLLKPADTSSPRATLQSFLET
jgi:hypothetical protein